MGPDLVLEKDSWCSQVSWYTMDTAQQHQFGFLPTSCVGSRLSLSAGLWERVYGQCTHVYMCVEARGQCLVVSLIVLHLILFYFETESLTETRID